MEQDYHILSIETFSNTEYGKMIRIVACPYEDTPLGYCYILNKQKKFNYPYSTDIFYRLSKLQESIDKQGYAVVFSLPVFFLLPFSSIV